MKAKRKTNPWPFVSMGAVIGIFIGVFGDSIEEWAQSFPFISEDSWVSMVLPGAIAGVIGGLVMAAIQFAVSKRNSRVPGE